MSPVRALRASAGPALRWWGPFLAGAAAGLAAGVVLGVRRAPPGAPDEGVEPRPGEGDDTSAAGASADRAWVERAWAGAVENLARARERLLAPEAPDVAALARRIEALPAGDLVRIRDLGDGIVEVVGSAPDEATAEALLDAVAAEPGVEVVVNRVWTPSSAVHNVPGL